MKYYSASAHAGQIYTITHNTYTLKGLFSSISMRFGTTGITEERAKRNRVYATLLKIVANMAKCVMCNVSRLTS